MPENNEDRIVELLDKDTIIKTFYHVLNQTVGKIIAEELSDYHGNLRKTIRDIVNDEISKVINEDQFREELHKRIMERVDKLSNSDIKFDITISPKSHTYIKLV